MNDEAIKFMLPLGDNIKFLFYDDNHERKVVDDDYKAIATLSIMFKRHQIKSDYDRVWIRDFLSKSKGKIIIVISTYTNRVSIMFDDEKDEAIFLLKFK